jgi:hypothetical protein
VSGAGLASSTLPGPERSSGRCARALLTSPAALASATTSPLEEAPGAMARARLAEPPNGRDYPPAGVTPDREHGTVALQVVRVCVTSRAAEVNCLGQDRLHHDAGRTSTTGTTVRFPRLPHRRHRIRRTRPIGCLWIDHGAPFARLPLAADMLLHNPPVLLFPSLIECPAEMATRREAVPLRPARSSQIRNFKAP